ncbi:MAG: molybdopterin molybdotransferase MoeA [Candidatus Nanopelagicales bacterium]
MNNLVEPEWYLARQKSFEIPNQLESVRLSLVNCLNKTLAKNLTSLHPLPPFNTSMMDGYAVAGNGPWKEIGKILAGGKDISIKDGECVAIATGAKVPENTFAVLRHEHSEINSNLVRLKEGFNLKQNQDIRNIGEEAQTGIEVLNKSTAINPAVLGLAASCGHDELEVVRNPIIDVLILGDELLDQGLPKDGKIRDSLSMQIPGWILNSDAEIGQIKKVPDDLEITKKAIAESKADIILTTGGTAKGPVDHIHPAINELNGELVIDEVKVRPGHPMLLAKLNKNQFLVGLPGNPLAACVAFVSLAIPVIRKMQGRNLEKLEQVVINQDVPAPDNEHRLFPVFIENNQATPVEHWGSAMLRGVAQSNAFVIVPPKGASKGTKLDYLKTPW